MDSFLRNWVKKNLIIRWKHNCYYPTMYSLLSMSSSLRCGTSSPLGLDPKVISPRFVHSFATIYGLDLSNYIDLHKLGWLYGTIEVWQLDHHQFGERLDRPHKSLDQTFNSYYGFKWTTFNLCLTWDGNPTYFGVLFQIYVLRMDLKYGIMLQILEDNASFPFMKEPSLAK